MVRSAFAVFFCVAIGAGCNALFGVDELSYDPNPGGPGGASTSSAGGAGAGGSVSGTGGVAGSSVATGGGGQGGAPASLVDTKLVARYYVDEADMGQGPAEILDAAPSPVAVPIQYTNVLSYVEVNGQRGLQATSLSACGAQVMVDGTKLKSMLQMTTTLTVEAVLDFPAATTNSARVLYFGSGLNDGALSFQLENGAGRLQLDFNDPSSATDSGTTAASLVGLGRVVAHAVADTNQADPDQRILFYLNGVEVPKATGPINTPPAQGAALDLGVGNPMMIGNRPSGDRTFVGTLYYLAIYGAALTVAEVANNAALLAGDDDTP